MSRCQQYGWKYFIVLTDDDLTSVNQEFETLCQISPENKLHCVVDRSKEIEQNYRWMDCMPVGQL